MKQARIALSTSTSFDWGTRGISYSTFTNLIVTSQQFGQNKANAGSFAWRGARLRKVNITILKKITRSGPSLLHDNKFNVRRLIMTMVWGGLATIGPNTTNHEVRQTAYSITKHLDLSMIAMLNFEDTQASCSSKTHMVTKRMST